MRSPGPNLQAKTWVTAYDRNGEPEWSQLPLHAAISYSAPFVVIQKLVELYPKAIQCTDNEGMLPIHLAFGFGASDNVLATLMEPFPASVNEIGLGGRYPYQCCELGPNKVRGKVYHIVSDQITERVTAEIAKDWRKFAADAQETLGMKRKEDLSTKTLNEFLVELLQDRKALEEAKRQPKILSVSSTKNLKASPSASEVLKRPQSRRSTWGRDKSGKKYDL
jgi:hypothetical protein